MKNTKAEIVVNGLVQGVGYRYFVLREAQKIGVNGFVKNSFTGDVLVNAEGEKALIEELIEQLKIGPMHASVKGCKVIWAEPKNEFTDFRIIA